MRVVVQRVLSAKVEVDGQTVSQIGPGLCVLAGIMDGDTQVDAEFMCNKILNMRLWPNESKGDKPWDQSVLHREFEILFVSQFTLYGQMKGNKPDFHRAMPPQLARPFYDSFLERCRRAYKGGPERIKDGIFGAMMQVHLVNDGPVTMCLDSRKPQNGSDKELATNE
eukprot:TRINITY_DN26807_c0_g1_i1.p1 TRINITY_DN26807_c0_g1~~TRINITY_DN26807_c0_g1_i1.p1  ORF type:complete len:167 (-),score=19.50 TRINITY_DN26807_c0_g1_i1:296-796(-)